ncbi:HNH endonuclease [Xenorhabdus bovienii]|uniref:HNH endonuclease signature motif containing protein n=3 Tax=Xenorhabdus bovienii TaxID=40576 RepID=UPI0023B218E6|nr:HNH endonuclease signature motif containing protein [Xenorhabdus bovienii]MDE9542858.1 HNH endonuclease [Xenorhabdus bovienii]MDE9552707.1 HNH endonuclease [Xenorhabdus bovienii]MDE9558014.1 HNH endonuclease [Xenorhabdus bovienii]
MTQFKYTPEMKEWMRENYSFPIGELTTKFNQYFSVNHTKKSLHGFRKRLGLRTGRTGYFPKGNIPHNAGTKGKMRSNVTSFKKGAIPSNRREVGSERIDSDGYVYIKVAHHKRWRLKSHVIWENHHGKLPDNTILIFRDGNSQNCHIDNLLMISREENAILNKCYSNTPTEYKQATVNLTRIQIAIKDREKQL